MISIMAFPRRGDSYTECFYPALESLGVKVHEGVFSGRWLLKNLRNIDYLHMHWPSFFYASPRPARCLRGFLVFLFLLALARWRGTRLLWTVHNAWPHDRCVIPALDVWARRLVVMLAYRFLVHGSSAEAEILRIFPRMAGRTVLVDHGHWIGYYANDITREAARARLGLAEEDCVFLFIGLCKPYKNLEYLIEAFQRLPARATLVIAGKFQDPQYETAIRTAVTRSKARIALHAGFVPENEIQTYLKASDAVVLPYRDVLTSGGAMLALSFGRPVVAPALGFLKDAVGRDRGILYNPSRPDGLSEAMAAAMQTHFDESRILAQVRKHDWTRSARQALAGLGEGAVRPV
ncbi:MAG TPA: glycosyltransferase [Alphaproteobacteria bacterium]|nr:glycosyltransferase [Alphaproteobacteria bacterium]